MEISFSTANYLEIWRNLYFMPLAGIIATLLVCTVLLRLPRSSKIIIAILLFGAFFFSLLHKSEPQIYVVTMIFSAFCTLLSIIKSTKALNDSIAERMTVNSSPRLLFCSAVFSDPRFYLHIIINSGLTLLLISLIIKPGADIQNIKNINEFVFSALALLLALAGSTKLGKLQK
jgi:hypothetical protein